MGRAKTQHLHVVPSTNPWSAAKYQPILRIEQSSEELVRYYSRAYIESRSMGMRNSPLSAKAGEYRHDGTEPTADSLSARRIHASKTGAYTIMGARQAFMYNIERIRMNRENAALSVGSDRISCTYVTSITLKLQRERQWPPQRADRQGIDMVRASQACGGMIEVISLPHENSLSLCRV